jgi:signal transduction histidine kinase
MNPPDAELCGIEALRERVEELRRRIEAESWLGPRVAAAVCELADALDETVPGGGPGAPTVDGAVEEVTRRATLAIDNARHYREAKRAVEMRERMLGVVSHDLRNSLNAALMNADLLLDIRPVFEPDSAALRQMEGLRRSLDLMHRLVQDLLDVDGIDSGRLSLRPARLPLSLVAREIEETFARLAEERGISLVVEFAAAGGEVRGDPDRVMQVFSNLVSNALGFTPAGGRVSVEALDAGASVLFRVADTGPGIPAEELPWIFDRYWKSTLHESTGAGLGLAIARGLVLAHGGEMSVESTLGSGTTFSFSLPRPGPETGEGGATRPR